jgi:hypothetical protein
MYETQGYHPGETCGMRTEVKVDQGSFSAEGDCIKPATITLICADVNSVGEYRSVMQKLAATFDLNDLSTALRKNRTVTVRTQDAIHCGRNPGEGTPSRA